MSKTHTPTPWKKTFTIGGAMGAHTIIENGDQYICHAYDIESNDTDFILRAVNAHDALVEALNIILQDALDNPPPVCIDGQFNPALFGELGEARTKMFAKARAALRLAEGE